jgi:CheY-like chemotaxis protein
MRVLIVDDEGPAQTALANVLSARRDVEHFDSANDAGEALEKLSTDTYAFANYTTCARDERNPPRLGS